MRNSRVTVVIVFNGKTQARSTMQLCENVISKYIYWVSSDWTSVNKVLLKTPVLFFGFRFLLFFFSGEIFLAVEIEHDSIAVVYRNVLHTFTDSHELICLDDAFVLFTAVSYSESISKLDKNCSVPSIDSCSVVSVVAVSVANFICSCCCCAFFTHRDGGNTSDGLVAWCLTEPTANVLTELYVEWVRTEERV